MDRAASISGSTGSSTRSRALPRVGGLRTMSSIAPSCPTEAEPALLYGASASKLTAAARSPIVPGRPRRDGAMLRQIRRVVTGHDEGGRSVIASDGPSPHVMTLPGRTDFGMTNLWITDASLA